jgi:hypothetical protein
MMILNGGEEIDNTNRRSIEEQKITLSSPQKREEKKTERASKQNRKQEEERNKTRYRAKSRVRKREQIHTWCG